MVDCKYGDGTYASYNSLYAHVLSRHASDTAYIDEVRSARTQEFKEKYRKTKDGEQHTGSDTGSEPPHTADIPEKKDIETLLTGMAEVMSRLSSITNTLSGLTDKILSGADKAKPPDSPESAPPHELPVDPMQYFVEHNAVIYTNEEGQHAVGVIQAVTPTDIIFSTVDEKGGEFIHAIPRGNYRQITIKFIRPTKPETEPNPNGQRE